MWLFNRVSSYMKTSESRNQETCGCSLSLSILKHVLQGNKRCTKEAEPSRTKEVYSLTSILKALTCSSRRFRMSLVCDCCSGKDSPRFEVAPCPLEQVYASSTRYDSLSLMCHVVGSEKFQDNNIDEQHRNSGPSAPCYSHYFVSELVEGDFSRNVVEIICQTSWLQSRRIYAEIQTVLKVHYGQETSAQFEQHRELVKQKAKRSHKHPRIMADGNELRKFYGTNIECSLGLDGSLGICKSDDCGVCRILRHGFSSKREFTGGLGILSCSTSKRAFDSIEIREEEQYIRKAVIICRVIAGRIHKPLDYLQKRFDRKVDSYGNIEDLYLLNARALLPCFVVIFHIT